MRGGCVKYSGRKLKADMIVGVRGSSLTGSGKELGESLALEFEATELCSSKERW